MLLSDNAVWKCNVILAVHPSAHGLDLYIHQEILRDELLFLKFRQQSHSLRGHAILPPFC